MFEEYYILLRKDDVFKKVYVDRKKFTFGSEEAKSAKLEEKNLFELCNLQSYDIVFNNHLILDNSTKREKEKLIDEKEKLLLVNKILQKDILEWTEEEIILIANSRVHGEIVTSRMRAMATTFEKEYKKIKDMIEEKKKTSKFNK